MLNISKPTLLIDEVKCKSNIRRMSEKARKHNLVLRPHFKTHQSHKVGNWCKEFGVDHITVSSMDMAQYFAGRFSDITLAIPFNLCQLDELKSLAKHQRISILVDRLETVKQLSASGSELGVWIEIDTGSNRSGIDPKDITAVQAIIDEVYSSDHLKLAGLYSHAGHTYRERDKNSVLSVFEDARQKMLSVRDRLETENEIIINLGDTPGCSLSDSFEGLQSISPGNFVFYDIMQVNISSCEPEDIGVCLACPVISKNEERSELVIYGGGIHLSKDRIEGDVYGWMVEVNKEGWTDPLKDCYLRSISQEHGVMKVSKEVFDNTSIGDIIGVLPVHSCMTADCMGSYMDLHGKKVDHMREKR